MARTHGTRSAYNAGCRCDACRDAEAERGRRRRLALGAGPRPDPSVAAPWPRNRPSNPVPTQGTTRPVLPARPQQMHAELATQRAPAPLTDAEVARLPAVYQSYAMAMTPAGFARAFPEQVAASRAQDDADDLPSAFHPVPAGDPGDGCPTWCRRPVR